uniref:Flavin-containing monooxygenase n=1 Tax=Leptocylindrus danicus TaxID=163516 RepID=A0A7S2LE57_9STRA|mmetsp:Transcript_3721/g.5414  ORF Transcript_3721/g.5414 Transcript_3721/m.5414 type:complete len:627 (+) Transcript_3721:117-1997(+)
MQDKKPTVCVVGAGIAGLATSKELKDVGISCDLYEMMPVIGGVFAHYGWKEGKLTSSTCFTWFSDFPIEDRQKHLAWPEWLAYLAKYVEHNGTKDCFNFNCKVVETKKVATGGWDVTVHRKNWSNGHWTHPEKIDVVEETFTKHYDYLVMGSGLHHGPSMPEWEGACSFKKAGGTLIHSAEFRKAEDFAGKNVVVVGTGESGSDIAWLCSKVAKKVHISYRNGPGTLFPHNINGNTADIRDSRLTYSMPRTVWPLLLEGQKRFFNNIQHEDNKARQKAFKFAADQNYKNKNCIFTINACKSFGIPKAVCFNDAEVKGQVCHFEGKTVYFKDGSKVEDVDAVIAATGFKIDIPAIKDMELKKKYAHPRYLWKNMVAVDEKEFFLVGFCRPHQINLITCCEMQARALSQIISGKKSFPTDCEMKADIEKTVEHMAHTFSRGYKGLVDFIFFNDGLAKFIGCEPNYVKTFFTDPMMWYPMTFGAFQPSQYRLSGPGANPKQARDAIMKTPYYKWRKERMSRDLNCFLVNFAGGFFDLFGIGSKHLRMQGQLRPVFKMFAMWYVTAVLGLVAFEQYWPAGAMSFGAFQLCKFVGGISASDRENPDPTKNFLMNMSHPSFAYTKKDEKKEM